ncbi:DUF1669 domain-containing protein [Helicobacter aurati]|uniref:phospholipase D n=1 Tax=Helicobacter aurati TaxID=137778 RepID=A0A3D8J0F1_9HELI|nr:phospholipase D-like domain-containing protein [Helicobacter aurati]RDU71009.1 DUF1669 domain-containing protein [Helicobacter aurati]
MQKNIKTLVRSCKIPTLCLLFAAFLTIGSTNAASITEKLYIMPYEQQEAIKDLVHSIMRAKTNIDIAIYSFTNREIAKALREANNKGVKINIIYDFGQKKTENSTIGYLEKFANIHTCLLEGKTAKNGKYNGIMHQKMIIIDNELIGLGSANWSKNAFENNYETLYFTDSSEIIAKASKYFQDMLRKCKPFMQY